MLVLSVDVPLSEEEAGTADSLPCEEPGSFCWVLAAAVLNWRGAFSMAVQWFGSLSGCMGTI